MSMLRGMIRMRRLASDDNLLSIYGESAVGHELDWLAFEIWRSLPEEPHLLTKLDSGVHPTLFEGIENWLSPKLSSNAKPALFMPYEELIDSTSHRQLLSIRQRLAHITGNFPVSYRLRGEEFQNWDDEYVKVRMKAKEIAAAICRIANSCIYERGKMDDIDIKIPNIFQRDNGVSYFLDEEAIDVTLKAPDGMSSLFWTMDAAYLEAILGLTLWAIVLNDRSRLGEQSATELVENARIISFHEQSEFEESLWYPVNVRWESSTAVIQFEEQEKLGLLNLWLSSSDNKKSPIWTTMNKEESNDTGGQTSCALKPREVFRLWGWSTFAEHLMKANAQDRQINAISAKIKFVRTKSSLVDICAQELFTYLLFGLKDALLRSPFLNEFNDAKPTINHIYRSLRMESSLVTKVVDMFVDSGLGTHTEALLCVVPALRSQFPTDTLELKALGVLALNGRRKSGVELEVVIANIESRLNTRSIGPFLRLLCDGLQLLHPTQQDRSQLLIFSRLYEQRESIISYRAEIKTIFEDYEEFLNQLEILDQQAVISGKAVEYALDATKLAVSLESNNLDSVLRFLAKAAAVGFGAEKSLPSSKEMSNALMVAARQGSVGVLCILMNLGLDPNETGDGAKSPLEVCLEHGHEVCARVLISFGASVRAPGDQGLVLLNAAIRRNQKAQVDLLLEILDIRPYDYVTAIAEAWQCWKISYRRSSILSKLIKRGSNIGVSPATILSGESYNPGGSLVHEDGLLYYCLRTEEEVIAIYGHHLMLWALHSWRGMDYSTARELVRAGVWPDQPLATPYSNTALHLAVKWPATLEILISDDKIHPNIEVTNGAGHTPLCKAVCEGQYKSATLLLERGASPELIGRGQRPMDCAIHNKDE